MVLTARPDSFTTSTKLTPSGVPSIGDLGPLAAWHGFRVVAALGRARRILSQRHEVGKRKDQRGAAEGADEAAAGRAHLLGSFARASGTGIPVVGDTSVDAARTSACATQGALILVGLHRYACARVRFRLKFRDVCAGTPANTSVRPGLPVWWRITPDR